VPSAEHTDQIARRGRYRSALHSSSRMLDRADRDDDLVPIRLHGVGMSLIEIENHARNERAGAVLPGTHSPHSVHIDRKTSYRVVGTSIGKVEQNPVGIRRGAERRFYRAAESNFHAQLRSLASRGHALQRRWPRCVLRLGARQQEHQSPEMFLSCHHSVLTLAGAPLAA